MAFDNFIDQLPPALLPLQRTAQEIGVAGMRATHGAVELGHTPEIGPEAFAIALFRPLESAAIALYEKTNETSITDPYRQILLRLNGCHAYELSLFGLPPSMAGDLPLLTRSGSQPFDLGTANRFWRLGYSAPADWLHIGSAPLSQQENVGYFQAPDGIIHALQKTGGTWATWKQTSEFLESELTRCQAMYPAHIAFMADLRRPKQGLLRRAVASIRGEQG